MYPQPTQRHAALSHEAIARAGLGHTIGVRPLTQLEQLHVQEVTRRAIIRHRWGQRLAWLVKGAVALVVLFAIFGGLYAAFGPQKWMAGGGFAFAAVMRGWFRARPSKRF